MVLPVFVTAEDVALLTPGVSVEKADAMIRAVTARALRVAPCLASGDLSEVDSEAARAVILDAVSRWAATGGGSVQSQTAGPFGYTVDTRQDRQGAFLRSEFEDLQGICSDLSGAGSDAFSIMLGGSRLAARATPVGLSYAAARSRGWVE